MIGSLPPQLTGGGRGNHGADAAQINDLLQSPVFALLSDLSAGAASVQRSDWHTPEALFARMDPGRPGKNSGSFPAGSGIFIARNENEPSPAG